jgi:hypothetical protein
MGLNNPSPDSTFLSTLFANLPTNDGDVHITVDTHLTADLFPVSLLIDAGVTLFTDNCRIYCLGTITNNGTISNAGYDGNNGTASAGGTAPSPPTIRTLYYGKQGRNGRFNGQNGLVGSDSIYSLGVNGAPGANAVVHTGGSAGTSTPLPANLTLFSYFYFHFSIPDILAANMWTIWPNAGSGSGAADAGAAGSGASGNAGGIVFICTTRLINNGTITAAGGAAGDPYDDTVTPVGGSAGGAGGLIIIYALILIVGTLSVAGGSSSSGVNGGAAAASASDGYIFTSYNF